MSGPEAKAAYYDADSGDLDAFAALCGHELELADLRFAAGGEKNVPVYECGDLAGDLTDPEGRRRIMAEWAFVLHRSAGVFVLRQAQPDHEAIDAASAVFEEVIREEQARGPGGADHFAAAGANSRIWNAAQKLCLADPQVFARYAAAPALDAACEAWLGPGYQLTAQVNVVRPGGAAQVAHRDYHLGFLTAEGAAAYPVHVHHLGPALTLQGALAHCDMPVESGPTKLLPFSQRFGPGYMAYRRPDFTAYFEAHCVQLPLAKGDAMFFSPALFHAAGANVTTDIHRMANLFQASSAFGRAMEAMDRAGMCRALYPVLQGMEGAARDAVIAAAAEGYAFPSNLDTDPPVGGLAPESMAGLMRRALDEGLDAQAFALALEALVARKEA